MKNTLTIINLFGSFIIFALVTDLFDHAFMFLLFGFIPGREEPLTANQMLIIYGISAVAVFSYGIRRTLERGLMRAAHYATHVMQSRAT